MKTLTKWEARRKELEDNYAEQMTSKYPSLTDVTTNTQRKNGTRMLELNHEKHGPTRFATYKSGMVRKIIRSRFNELSCYQLNPTRTSIRYWMGSDMKVKSFDYKQRVPINDGVNRLVYLEKYLIKNYNLTEVKDIIMVDGFLYKRI